MAAVIGTEVPLPLLQAIAEQPATAVHDGLRQLQAAEFLYETHLVPEHAYSFKHALTHEVAYGSLPQERRRVLHVRIVEIVEALSPDRLAEQVERLAHHALRGEIWDKALVYYRQAGDKAMVRSAYREAAACFEQALTALRHLPEQHDTLSQALDLCVALHSALHMLGEVRQSFAYLRQAETFVERLGDQRRLCESYRAMTHKCWVL
jgi:predicted ATPase